mmetsp:Transcript_1911/g.2743  ORF Transcript_1911/g.2743 Transcript_1911/m.2743 type:complete len:315 (+) Transcript_1911:385-1329(+)
MLCLHLHSWAYLLHTLMISPNTYNHGSMPIVASSRMEQVKFHFMTLSNFSKRFLLSNMQTTIGLPRVQSLCATTLKRLHNALTIHASFRHQRALKIRSLIICTPLSCLAMSITPYQRLLNGPSTLYALKLLMVVFIQVLLTPALDQVQCWLHVLCVRFTVSNHYKPKTLNSTLLNCSTFTRCSLVFNRTLSKACPRSPNMHSPTLMLVSTVLCLTTNWCMKQPTLRLLVKTPSFKVHPLPLQSASRPAMVCMHFSRHKLRFNLKLAAKTVSFWHLVATQWHTASLPTLNLSLLTRQTNLVPSISILCFNNTCLL